MRRGYGWNSLSRKLPLLVTTLLALMVLAISMAAYRELTRALVRAAQSRLLSISQQIALDLSQSNDRMRQQGTPLSRAPELRHVLEAPSATTLASARERVNTDLSESEKAVRIELWTMDGRRVLSASAAGDGSIDSGRPPAALGSPAGPLVAVGDSVFSDIRLPILGARHDTIGILRQLAGVASPQSRQVIHGLIGPGAIVLIGNTSGDVWTDLSRRVPAPRLATKRGEPLDGVYGSHGRVVAASTEVRGMPWRIWIGLPSSIVLADANALLYRLLAIAVGLLAIGAAAAWGLGRVLLAPLREVTGAAERMARGDYGQRVTATRGDEVGELASAFNVMASSVQDAQVELENQATELESQQAELEAANDALRQQVKRETDARARAGAIVAGALDGIISMDARGHIVEFNPAAEAMFGHAASEVIGKPVSDVVVPPSLRGRHTAGVARYLATGEARLLGRRAEFSAMRADGSEFPIEITIIRNPIDGAPLFTCFCRDLSQQRQLETQLQQSRKLEAVGQLAGGVAHDFNNLLTVIISYSEMMATAPELVEPLRGDLGQIRAAADRAAVLTRQLLAFSRKQALRPTVVDINAVVDDTSALLSRVMPADIDIETRLDPDVNLIHVDRGQLEQVLMNLVVNARDAMPSGGRLTIETANVLLEESYVALHAGAAPGPHVVLTVRDTGVGMDAATRERIFEPFFTTKGPGQGTGLGLATIYGIVKQSGGSIYVYSELGQGTTFKLYFPRYTGDGTAAPRAAETPASVPAPLHVLIVEDQPAVREAARRILEQWGHHVVEAPDAQTGLDLMSAATTDFDLVITDAVMPGQSGVELVEQLRRSRPLLPIIIMSGYTEEAARRGRPAVSHVAFLEKPFSGDALARAVQGAIAAVREIATLPRRDTPSGSGSVR